MAIKITKGSPNIFRDLGFSPVEAEHLRVRAELMLALERLIARRRLTQGRAGARAQRYLARPPFAAARALKGMRPLDPYSRPRKVDVRLIPAPSPWTRFPQFRTTH